MRLTHYTAVAWDMLCFMARSDRDTGVAGRYSREELGITSNMSMRNDVMKLLVKAEIISSQRGANGGDISSWPTPQT